MTFRPQIYAFETVYCAAIKNDYNLQCTHSWYIIEWIKEIYSHANKRMIIGLSDYKHVRMK